MSSVPKIVSRMLDTHVDSLIARNASSVQLFVEPRHHKSKENSCVNS